MQTQRIFESKKIFLNGIHLHFVISMHENSQTFCFMFHGFLDHCHTFKKLSKYLPNDWTLVACDWRGHGDSDRNPDSCPEYTFNQYLLDMKRLIEEVIANEKVEDVYIIAHSLATSFAPALVSLVPSLPIKAIVCMDAILPIFPQELYLQYSEELHRNIFKRNLNGHSQKFYETKEEMLKKFEKTHTSENPKVAREIGEMNIIYIKGKGYTWKFDHRLKMDQRFWVLPPNLVKEILENINCPILFLAAENGYGGKFYNFYNSQFKFFKNIKPIIVKNVGHHLHLEEPQKIAKLICNYFNECKNVKLKSSL